MCICFSFLEFLPLLRVKGRRTQGTEKQIEKPHIEKQNRIKGSESKEGKGETAMKKRINKILDTLADAQMELADIIEEREEIFENRSEKWQESEKGDEYQGYTEQLQEIANSLEYAEEARQ